MLQLFHFMDQNTLRAEELNEVVNECYMGVELHGRVYTQLNENTPTQIWKTLIDEADHLATNIIRHPLFPKELHSYALFELPDKASDSMKSIWIESAAMFINNLDESLATDWLSRNINGINEHDSVVENTTHLTEELFKKLVDLDELETYAATAILATRWLYNDNCSMNMSNQIINQLEQHAAKHDINLVFKIYANIVLSGNHSRTIAKHLISNFENLDCFFQTEFISLLNKGIEQKDYRYSII